MECSVSGCGGRVFSGGLCSRHYNRKLTTGTTDDGPRARADFATRFWRQVEKRGPDECWPWIAKSKISGYGTIATGGRGTLKMQSNRAAWTLTHGAIPDGQVVRHKCHNRLCCNPAHLEIGTQTDNVADMWARGPEAKRGNARLSEADVEAILKDPRSSRKLAPVYGVDHTHIRKIRQKRVWRNRSGSGAVP